MGEEDMTLGNAVVDRLTAAKAVIADFLDRRAGDRVGLLVFGQKAYALTPLTLDRESVRQQLRDSVVGLAGRETAIGDRSEEHTSELQSLMRFSYAVFCLQTKTQPSPFARTKREWIDAPTTVTHTRR